MKQIAKFDGIRHELRNKIQSARSEIKLAVAWLTDEDLIRELALKAYDQCDVQIAISNAPENFYNPKKLQKLVDSGAKLFVSHRKFLHHKFAIFDRRILITGSYNWTYYATSNEENIVIVEYNDSELIETSLVNQFSIRFKSLIVKNCIEVEDVSSRNAVISTSLTTYEIEIIRLRKNFEDEIENSLQLIEEMGLRINTDKVRTRMLREGGGVELVSRLISEEMETNIPKWGFQKLSEAGRLDLAFESIVLKDDYRPLFAEQEINYCTKLLR